MLTINNPDKHLENEGVWTSFGGSSFKVASMSNMKYQKLFSRLQIPHHKKIEKGSLDPRVALDLMCQALSQSIVLDWKDVLGDEGEPVTFSVELCDQILRNHSDLRNHIQEFANDIENFRVTDREALGKA